MPPCTISPSAASTMTSPCRWKLNSTLPGSATCNGGSSSSVHLRRVCNVPAALSIEQYLAGKVSPKQLQQQPAKWRQASSTWQTCVSCTGLALQPTLPPALVMAALTSEAERLTLSVRHSITKPVPPWPYASYVTCGGGERPISCEPCGTTGAADHDCQQVRHHVQVPAASPAPTAATLASGSTLSAQPSPPTSA